MFLISVSRIVVNYVINVYAFFKWYYLSNPSFDNTPSV